MHMMSRLAQSVNQRAPRSRAGSGDWLRCAAPPVRCLSPRCSEEDGPAGEGSLQGRVARLCGRSTRRTHERAVIGLRVKDRSARIETSLRHKCSVHPFDRGDTVTHMRATLIRHSRLRFADGGLIEVKLWSVSPSPDKPHGFKYSLVYIERRKRIIGYDNGERRGDHRHYEGEEESYEFMTVDDLIADFMADVDRWRREK